MTHSCQARVELSCAECGEDYVFDAWVVIDIAEHPDLLERIRHPSPWNSLHLLVCSACRTWGQLLDLPLLLYCPGKSPPLLFSPPDGSTAEQAKNVAVELVSWLRQSLGDGWRPEWKDQVKVVVREHLPAALAEALECDGRPPHDSVETSIETQIDLGLDLVAEFERSGHVSQLDAAIEVFGRALDAAGPGSPNRLRCHLLRGHALRKRFELLKENSDLDAAIAAYKGAVHASVEAGDRDAALGGLAGGLLRRFEAKSDRADLDAAIETIRQILTEVPDRSPEWALAQNNLGVALLSRFESVRETGDLAEAIGAFQHAVGAAADGSLEWAHRQTSLGRALFHRYELLGRDEGRDDDFTAATAAYERALGVFLPDVWPAACFNVANHLGHLWFHRRQWRKSAMALVRAVRAIDAVYRVQDSHAYREAWLLRALSTCQLAAYALARVGHLRAAAVILEQGRARSLSQALSDRGQASLAGRTWDCIAAAVSGPDSAPLAYIATTTAGGLVLLVHRAFGLSPPSTPLVDVLWLPDFADRDLHKLLGEPDENGEVQAGWVRAYDLWRQDPSRNHRLWLDAIEQCTHGLWQILMESVVNALHSLGCRCAVLIPSDLLAILPLHAAWTEQDGRRVYALDHIIFSYAPSARVLTHARELEQAVPAERLLAVDEPAPVTLGGALPNARAEVQAVASRDLETSRLSENEKALFRFVDKVNRQSPSITPADMVPLYAAGWDDEVIYYAITVCALFNFYNRWIDASGVHALSDEAHRQGGKRSAVHGYVRK